MPLPASLSTRTVVGTFLTGSGAPDVGKVVFRRTVDLQSGGTTLAQYEATAVLDASGSFSISLPVTDDPDWSPVNWPYLVLVRTAAVQRDFQFLIPSGSGDLSLVLSGNTPVPPSLYVPLAAVGQIGGPAGPLDGTGKVPSSQLPAGQGGSAVASVNGKTGVVTLNAAEVGAADSANGVVYPLAGYGLVAASDDPATFMGQSQWSDSGLFLVRMFVPAGKAIAGLWVAVRGAGVHNGSTTGNRLALYDDTGVRLDMTADDSTLWTAVGWRGGPLAGGPQPAQGAGRFVYAGGITRGMTTPPTAAFPASAGDWACFQAGPGGTKRRCIFQAGQTAVPASFDPTAFGSPTGFMPLLGIS